MTTETVPGSGVDTLAIALNEPELLGKLTEWPAV
jgi:hypothetical protein